MFIDDIHIEVDGYGDADNFILLTIGCTHNRYKNIQKSFPIENATPELIGNAVAEFIKDNFWKAD